MFKVIRDTREQNGWSFTMSKDIEEIIDRKLDTGDYAVEGLEDKVCIERKASTAEIALNITKKAFHKELIRMLDYEHRFIICEFSLGDVLNFPLGSGIPQSKHSQLKISPAYLMKCLTEIQLKYGVQIVYCQNKKIAEEYVSCLLKRIYERH